MRSCRTRPAGLYVERLVHLHELDLLAAETHVYIGGLAVPVLGYDDLGSFLVPGIFRQSHIIGTVDEDDHIGILLDGAGLAKVA